MKNMEDYRIPESVFYDEKIHMHLLRTRFFEIKGHQLITKRQYNINGELYEVNVSKFVELANKYMYIKELTPEIIRTFISKIVIHQNPEGSMAKYRIEIFFTHIGSLLFVKEKEQAA